MVWGGSRDVFNSGPTIVGPPLRAKNYSNSGHLRQNLFSAHVLVALIRLWTECLDPTTHPESLSAICNGDPQPTHGESPSRVTRKSRERPPHKRRSIRFAARDSKPAGRHTKKGQKISHRVELRHRVSSNHRQSKEESSANRA